jgi:hypothetical protein
MTHNRPAAWFVWEPIQNCTEHVSERSRNMSPKGHGTCLRTSTEHVSDGHGTCLRKGTEHVSERARNMSPTVTEHVSERARNMSPTGTKHVSDGHETCIRQARNMSPTGTEYVSERFPTRLIMWWSLERSAPAVWNSRHTKHSSRNTFSFNEAVTSGTGTLTIVLHIEWAALQTKEI